MPTLPSSLSFQSPRWARGGLFVGLLLSGCGLNTDHVCTAYMEGVVEAAQYNEFDLGMGDTGSEAFTAWSYPDTLCDCPAESELQDMSRDDAFELGWANFCVHIESYGGSCKGVETARKNIKHTGVDGKSPALGKAFWTGAKGHGYDNDKTCQQLAGGVTDRDGDGFGGPLDCDDSNADVHPDAAEICDGIDNDCDDLIDDADDLIADPTTWYQDDDRDDHGTADVTVEACARPVGYASADNDCDDEVATIYTGAAELCDGLDNDCDGALIGDEIDDDGDGFVECSAADWAASTTVSFDDCDDTEITTYPGASDTWYDGVDSDCGGESDYDADRDGFDSADHGGDDCDDTNATIHPDGEDGLLFDTDCDGAVGGGELTASEYLLAYEDLYISGLSGAGDVTAGGRPDFLVSLSYAGSTDRREVQLFAGENLGARRELDATAPDFTVVNDLDNGSYLLGSGEGDVDGDGRPDILLGLSVADLGAEDGGAAFVILGTALDSHTSVNLSSADHILQSSTVGMGAGTTIAYAGDLDGDNRTDLLVGATGTWPDGAVYLVMAASLDGSSTVDLDESAYVIQDAGDPYDAMATAGDVDGDGLSDVLVGSNWDGMMLYLADDLGSTRVLTFEDASYTFESPRCAGSGDGLGSASSTAGDLDDDGLDDFLLGAQYDCDGGSHAGAAFVVFSDNLGTTQSLAPVDVGAKLIGTGSNLGAGGDVANGGDVDGDGRPDVLVSTNLLTSFANGRVWLMYGDSIVDGTTHDLASADAILTSPYTYDGTGKLGHLGDVDGDNRSDVMVASSTKVWLALTSPGE